MSDQKTERLINLTMALLATKRFLSKAEILHNVAGYFGNDEAKDRMFERDKDDLRSIGIEIQVGNNDPLFEDEPGYRILESDFSLELGELTPSEFSYLSLAATLWRNQLFAASGAQALMKLEALSGAALREDYGHATLSLENETPLFPALWEAIIARRNISFSYRSKSISTRNLSPYGLTLWHGSWYLAGFDLDKADIRVFKVSRISSEISFATPSGAFTVPQDFSIESHLVMMRPELKTQFTARVRVGRCQSLRSISNAINIDGEWDRVEFVLGANWMEQILWFGSDIILEAPQEKVQELVELLRAKL